MTIIKQASLKDVETLALLGRVTYSESHGNYINNTQDLFNYNNEAFSIQKTHKEVGHQQNLYWIAYVDEFPVGYAKLILNATNEHITNRNVCRLERIYVLEEFLGQKIGFHLYQTVLHKAKELNFKVLWLTTYIKNHKAMKFYEKLNFKKVGNYSFWVNGKAFENFIYSKEV